MQKIILSINHCETVFLDEQTYEYGSDKEYATFTKASNAAIKDFDKESMRWFKESLNRRIDIKLKLVDSEFFMIKNIIIKSNGNSL